MKNKQLIAEDFSVYSKLRDLLDKKILSDEIPLMSLSVYLNAPEEFHKAITDGSLGIYSEQRTVKEKFTPIIIGSNPPSKRCEGNKTMYDVVIDPSKTLDALIKEGNYDSIDKRISEERLPFTVSERTELSLTWEFIPYEVWERFGGKPRRHKSSTPEERTTILNLMIEEWGKKGLRPAYFQEHLAFGAKFPNEQRYGSLFSVGSIWKDGKGNECVGALTSYGPKRRLGLWDLQRVLSRGERFLMAPL